MSENDRLNRILEFCHELCQAANEDPRSPDARFLIKAAQAIRYESEALAAQLAEARNDGIDLRRYATELEIALGQVSPLAKHIITDIRNECRITSEFMGENITGDLPDTGGTHHE
jgi:hypothetical protein